MVATLGRRPTRPGWRPQPPPDRVAAVLGVAGVGVVAGVLALLMERSTYDVWAAIPTAIGLAALSVPLLRRAARLEADPFVARLLWWALGLKLVASLARYYVAFGLYDGAADANAYSRVGADIARQLRDGDWTIDIGKRVQGTGFIEVLTGGVFTVTGATTIGGFLVFSWFGFWGLYLFHRAFVRAVPDGDHRRHALLVLLLPSLLFWPSSIGKEAWMCLFLGLGAHGAARVLTRARGGLLLCGVASLALGIVRPHIAAILVFALALAVLARRTPAEGRSAWAPFAKLAVLAVVGLALVFAVGQLEDFFGVDDFNAEAVRTTLDEVQRRTGQGGSQFVADSDTDLDPSRLPAAFVNVLFRPFPWHATNVQSLVAAGESLLLMGLVLTGWRRIVASAAGTLRNAYLVLCWAFAVLFVYGFSSFSNAGILVRQRVQVLPFVLVLLCVAPLGRRARVASEPRT